ncbi:MAG: hypothetical protein JSW27_20205, partial [Phycisphaerales bacterium]
VHSGDLLLPRSSLPPQRHGDFVFLRDEEYAPGRQTNRLWWLKMAEPVHVSVLDRGLEALTAAGFRVNQVTSYCVTSGGDLWVCTSPYWASSCLLRRAQNGGYSIGAASGSVRFLEGWPETRPKYEGAYMSAVTALPDDTLLLASRTGIYRLQGNTLKLELHFTLDKPLEELRDRVVNRVTWRRQGDKMVKEVTKVVQKASERDRKVVGSVTWNPNNVLQLEDGSYFLGTDTWEGAYWIRQDDESQWSCLPANEGDPVVW